MEVEEDIVDRSELFGCWGIDPLTAPSGFLG